MQFQIPKQTDRNLVSALSKVCDELRSLRNLTIEVLTNDQGGSTIQLRQDDPVQMPAIEFVLIEESQIMPSLSLRDANGQHGLTLQRQPDKITDLVAVAHDQNWVNHLPQETRSKICVKLISLTRKHLRALDAEAALSSGSDAAWTRYRDAQLAILNSLEETQKTILSEYSRKSLEAEAATQDRFRAKETDLQKKFEAQEQKLIEEYALRNKDLDARENELKAREASFNTKEARYVARQEQQNQIRQIQGWLEGWSLTSGTRAKRYPVAAAYACGIAATGTITVWLSYQSARILESAGANLSAIAWWQWVLLSSRSILPLAAFITFVIYFIRWSGSWARQHAEEEFRNRARMLDIGRTAWLIEAVRDAQDNQKELPTELVQELSRNLFAYSPSVDTGDVHPQSIADLILQGLSSLRVKIPGGTEVEAKRRGIL
jgi:hypothetical protein